LKIKTQEKGAKDISIQKRKEGVKGENRREKKLYGKNRRKKSQTAEKVLEDERPIAGGPGPPIREEGIGGGMVNKNANCILWLKL